MWLSISRLGQRCHPGPRLSSGESLHKRGYRVEQTEAPSASKSFAAGIILRSGWRGDHPFVDPMCGSGTFSL